MKRQLSTEELDTIIRLRQLGASWLKIQRDTKIHRQTAKRAYERWTKSKSLNELSVARKEVAASEFNKHKDSLIELATSLLIYMRVPDSLADMDKNAKQFFSWLWELDLLERFPVISTDTMQITSRESKPRIRDMELYRREKQLLFDSLNVHTREKVTWQDLLDNRWNKAKDNSAKLVPKLREQTSKVVKNYINQERDKSFLFKVKKESKEDDPAKLMAEVLLREIWQQVIHDKLGEEGPWFQIVTRSTGKARDEDIIVKSRGENAFKFIGDTNMGLAQKVNTICNLACNNLREGDTVQQLHREVRIMEKAREELREMLNPVKLLPMILLTRCDLCPA